MNIVNKQKNNVLYYIINSNLQKSYRLADLVIDDEHSLYIHFRNSSKLELFLKYIRKSFIEIMRINPHVIDGNK
jgi:hypothetical protein